VKYIQTKEEMRDYIKRERQVELAFAKETSFLGPEDVERC